MEQIIQQITLNLAKNITEKALEGGLSDIDALASDVLSDCKAAARSIVETIVSEMNLQIRSDKAFRKESGLVLKEKDRSRALLTEIGEINIKRDYFRIKSLNAYGCILDEMLGIRAYERIGDNVRAKLISAAADVSYAKSSQIVTDGVVSRQTVHKLITKAPAFEISAPEEKKGIKALHIYADEDHVHMQKPLKMKGKQNRIVPLVTVSEGVARECKHRNHTINPKHFVDEEFSPNNLWKAVDEYLKSSYEGYGQIPIYIYGDGGGWIKRGLDCIPNSHYVVDGYHYERDLKQVAKLKPNIHFTRLMHYAVLMNDKAQAERAISRLKEGLTGDNLKKAKDFEIYITNHWDAVVRRTREDTVGSCTEAQVSHVLSERFSRNPMGWSKVGLGKLSKARVFKINGGEITGELLKTKSYEREKAEELAKDVLRYDIGGNFDWSVFDGYEAGNMNAGTSYYRTGNGGWGSLYS